MLLVAVVYEEGKAIRAFKDNTCIYSAYKWCHRHFCLNEYEPRLPLHRLPDWLKVEVYHVTEEQFNKLVK